MKLNRVITHKMQGDDVRWLQKKLKDIGFYLDKPDGFYGQSTLMSVFNFQNHVVIKADGVFGSQTWSQLINYKSEVLSKSITKDIQLNISYSDEFGFKIYDSIVSDEFFYKEEFKKNTIFIKSVYNNYNPDIRPEFWKPIFKRDENGNTVIAENGNPVILKSACHYIIGSEMEDSSIWNGKVIRFFDDKYWSNYIDSSNINLDIMSITIELCNDGPLIKRDDKFYTMFGKLVKGQNVIELETPFKGYKYWSKYSNEQIQSLNSLLKYLINKWNMDIEKNMYNESWFDYHKKWISTDGIRIDSQLDINTLGVFPQKDIINMLNNI